MIWLYNFHIPTKFNLDSLVLFLFFCIPISQPLADIEFQSLEFTMSTLNLQETKSNKPNGKLLSIIVFLCPVTAKKIMGVGGLATETQPLSVWGGQPVD